MPDIAAFEHNIRQEINKFSLESLSDTPDFVLASFLRAVLEAYNAALVRREEWYGRSVMCKDPDPAPAKGIPSPGPDYEPECSKAGPGRGDCAHFIPLRIGMPMDTYGKPFGWCWSCWNSHRYHELIYAVARAFPGETRHQTALRYIRETEANCHGGPCLESSLLNWGAAGAPTDNPHGTFRKP